MRNTLHSVALATSLRAPLTRVFLPAHLCSDCKDGRQIGSHITRQPTVALSGSNSTSIGEPTIGEESRLTRHFFFVSWACWPLKAVSLWLPSAVAAPRQMGHFFLHRNHRSRCKPFPTLTPPLREGQPPPPPRRREETTHLNPRPAGSTLSGPE